MGGEARRGGRAGKGLDCSAVLRKVGKGPSSRSWFPALSSLCLGAAPRRVVLHRKVVMVSDLGRWGCWRRVLMATEGRIVEEVMSGAVADSRGHRGSDDGSESRQ